MNGRIQIHIHILVLFEWSILSDRNHKIFVPSNSEMKILIHYYIEHEETTSKCWKWIGTFKLNETRLIEIFHYLLIIYKKKPLIGHWLESGSICYELHIVWCIVIHLSNGGISIHEPMPFEYIRFILNEDETKRKQMLNEQNWNCSATLRNENE